MPMKANHKILITGAGIAGPACAYWLARHGYSVVIAEQANAFRDGGQNVDIKGAGQFVIEKMGITAKVAAKNTNEQGQRYVDAAGKVVAVFPKGSFGSLTADYEILRGDFAQILYEVTSLTCEYRFNCAVTHLEEGAESIHVAFNDGSVEDFELVICAEGISSKTRNLVFPNDIDFRYLGAYMSFFKIPRRPEDDNWVRTLNGAGGTFINVRPGDEKETTVLVTFPRDTPDVASDNAQARRQFLIDALQGRGVLAERIIDALGSVRDFYFGPMSQVRAPKWSKGRFVMIGDAAYCPTPFTGEGTALALVGAYVLAGEIKRRAAYPEALNAYESLVRPYVERSQDQMSPLLIRLLHAKSSFAISLMRVIQKCFASAVMQRLLKPSDTKRRKRVETDFAFPDYD